MIIVRTLLCALPEKQKEVMQTLLSIIELPANGNGLLSYGIYQDVKELTVFRLISEWESRRHVTVHLQSDRFGILLGTTGLLCSPIDVQILNVTRVEGTEAVIAARQKRRT